ncbi:MAG: acyloxyacyl hydrolase [Campylobacterota bacterium]|nr:acyloxyacyl hydrolase [Campylobacterota bacterium]
MNLYSDNIKYPDDISIGIGKDSSINVDIYRFALRKEFNDVFFKSENGFLSGYYEASLNLWDSKCRNIQVLAFSPVFVYYFNLDNRPFKPYIEAGIGAAYLSDKICGEREFSTLFQFEDRIGFGISTKDYNIDLRYMHYSNGGIKEPNDGINSIVLSLTFPF